MQHRPPHGLVRYCTALAACLLALTLSARAAERVGTYDSRVVAYACFWAPAHQAQLKSLRREGLAARARGDKVRYQEIDRRMAAIQAESHLQIMSTAPIPEHLARLQAQVAAIQRETGVSRLLSQWDEAALKDIPAADRIDVTGALISGLPLDASQRKMAADIAASKPLPLWKARLLAAIGKL